jgi:hypothetical protein
MMLNLAVEVASQDCELLPHHLCHACLHPWQILILMEFTRDRSSLVGSREEMLEVRQAVAQSGKLATRCACVAWEPTPHGMVPLALLRITTEVLVMFMSVSQMDDSRQSSLKIVRATLRHLAK